MGQMLQDGKKCSEYKLIITHMKEASNTEEKEKSHPTGHEEYGPKVLKSLLHEVHEDIVVVGVVLVHDHLNHLRSNVSLLTPPPKEG